MGRFVNPGNDRFLRNLKNNMFVDKTIFISYINTILESDDAFMCFTRPRRFGKTTVANMLTAYYSIGCSSQALFDDLAIGSTSDYLNAFNVISVDLNSFVNMDGNGQADLVNFKETLLKELIREFSLDSSVRSLPDAIYFAYRKSKTKFVVVIDEWDAFFRYYPNDDAVLTAYVNLLRKLFKASDVAEALALVYLTGILPIKKYKVESALNNFMEYTMLNSGKFASFIGFTETEVLELCRVHGGDFDKMKNWYDGYIVSDMHMYNSNSVISALKQEKYQSYWSRTGSFTLLSQYIRMDFYGLKEGVFRLLSGESVSIKPSTFQNDLTNIKSKDDVFTLLIHLGFLRYKGNEDSGEVSIPNREVMKSFNSALDDNGWVETSNALIHSKELLQLTIAGKEIEVAKRIGKVHQENVSILKYNDENSIACVLSIAYLAAKDDYHLERELASGKGFADIVFIPKKPNLIPMIVELKYGKSAEQALAQIKQKEYFSRWNRVILVGINYDDKKEYTCKIENWKSFTSSAEQINIF